jgi:hypothetical protein
LSLKIDFQFTIYPNATLLSIKLVLILTYRTHEKLGDLIEGKLEDANVWKGAKYAPDVSANWAKVTFSIIFATLYMYIFY